MRSIRIHLTLQFDLECSPQQWQHPYLLRLFFLPSNSPERAPDELLNQDAKSNIVGRQRAHEQRRLVRSVRGYLRCRPRHPHVVKRSVEEQHVRYAKVVTPPLEAIILLEPDRKAVRKKMNSRRGDITSWCCPHSYDPVRG